MIDVSRDELLRILDDIRQRVATGDSWEGFINYLFPEEHGEGRDFAVHAGYRIGNLDHGQGFFRHIGLPVDTGAGHNPVWMPGGEEKHHVASCACGAQPGAELHGSYWFADHLREHGAPDYLVGYWREWADIVEAPGGALSRDQVARELSDYRHLLTEIPKVYDELSGGRFSKPNTAAHNVIEAADARSQAAHIDLVLCDLLPQLVHGTDRQTVVDYVEDLAPGAYDQHLKNQEQVSRLRAANAGAY